MDLKASLNPTIDRLRGLKPKLGLVDYSVTLVIETQTGYGKLPEITEIPITNCDGYAPSIKALSEKSFWQGAPQDAELLMVLTPEYEQGGYSASDFQVENGESRVFLRLNGTGQYNQTLWVVSQIQEKSFKLKVYLKRLASVS